MNTASPARILIFCMALTVASQASPGHVPGWTAGGHYRFYLRLCKIDTAQWFNVSKLIHAQSVFAVADEAWQPDPCLLEYYFQSHWPLLIESLDAEDSYFDALESAPKRSWSFQHHQDLRRVVVLLGTAAVSYHRSGLHREAHDLCSVMFRILGYMADSPTSFSGALSTIRASITALGVWHAVDGFESVDDENAERITAALERLSPTDPLGVVAALRDEADHMVELAKSIADPDRDLHPDLEPADSDTLALSTQLRSDSQAALVAVNGVRDVLEAIVALASAGDMKSLHTLETEVRAGKHGRLASHLIPSFEHPLANAFGNRRLIDRMRSLMQFDRLKRTASSIRDLFVPDSLLNTDFLSWGK